MKTIKVSVIGVGHLGSIHTRIFHHLEGVELVGVYDTDPKRCNAVAAQYHTHAYNTVSDAIAAADAVSIATHTHAHYAIASQCILAGKDILIEKPVTSHPDEAHQLAGQAKNKNIIIQVGHVERFNAVISTLQNIISCPRFIEVHRMGPYGFRSLDIGVVRDLMIHDIDIILHLVQSDIVRVDAIGIPVLSEKEDIANARLVFENGCVVNINASRVSLKKLRKIRIFEAERYVSVDYSKQKASCYEKKDFSGKTSLSFLDFIRKKNIKITKNEPLYDELSAFINAVRHRTPPVVTLAHGTKALEVVHTIQCHIEKSLL